MTVGRLIKLLVISVLTEVGLVLLEVELSDEFSLVLLVMTQDIRKKKIRERLLMFISAVV